MKAALGLTVQDLNLFRPGGKKQLKLNPKERTVSTAPADKAVKTAPAERKVRTAAPAEIAVKTARQRQRSKPLRQLNPEAKKPLAAVKIREREWCIIPAGSRRRKPLMPPRQTGLLRGLRGEQPRLWWRITGTWSLSAVSRVRIMLLSSVSGFRQKRIHDPGAETGGWTGSSGSAQRHSPHSMRQGCSRKAAPGVSGSVGVQIEVAGSPGQQC